MRGMIVAAGLGTRMRPLSDLRPKPALPIRGVPLVAYPLALLARHGVTEVIINVHAMPDVLIEAAEHFQPEGMKLEFSVEEELLDTGGGIRRAADFLRESDPCVVIGGDMLLDTDLSELVAVHRARGDAFTMLLLDDDRSRDFGSVGVDHDGRVRRIGPRFDLGGEARSGIYVWANVIAARAFDTLPNRDVFSHLDHWIAPQLEAGARDIRGEVVTAQRCSWIPVGTPEQYLAANLETLSLSYLDAQSLSPPPGTRIENDVILGAGATLGAGARLRRAVVWENEAVPVGLTASDGVFAGGTFHRCRKGAEGSQ
ncbi:MAG: NDP-sugar synthase [Deltaproteobacteria bacterium]|nr:MAG: NDP-sugar synthase [Deltaproteobacteria bacterium]